MHSLTEPQVTHISHSTNIFLSHMTFFEHAYQDTYLCVSPNVSVWRLCHLENLVVFW